jgi:hypothetical protein
MQIEPEDEEAVKRDVPTWLIQRLTVRGSVLTDSALYYKSSSPILLRTPQTKLRLPLTDILDVSVRRGVEWRAAHPSLSSFQVTAAEKSYVFQTAHSDAWVAAAAPPLA